MTPDQPNGDVERALREQRAWLDVTLSSIGDAVVTTDAAGLITFLNPVAESLTGWSQADAAGIALDTIFHIVNQETRLPVDNPATRALRDGLIVGLANHTVLIAKDGTERPIDDSAAPIRHPDGQVAGVVLVFRDITERYRQEQLVEAALALANDIIATLREPFLVLDHEFRVRRANDAFYSAFHVSKDATEGHSVFELGNGQWDIPDLRRLLAHLDGEEVRDYSVEHDFPGLGRRIMLLNARRLHHEGADSGAVLLAIEDVTERRTALDAVEVSETRYRRLFEAAQDGILILDGTTGKIEDANPFLERILGYPRAELIGRELWQIGFFSDAVANRKAFEDLQRTGYIRYEHLPLRTRAGAPVDVEFVSNAYCVDHREVIQCNIRDISDRVALQRQSAEHALALADASRRKDEFLAMLSHELRNPLAPITNAVHLLRQDRDATPLRRRATEILERQTAQLSMLVDDLLEVSRITTGKFRLHEERIDACGVVARAVETTDSVVNRRSHTVEVSLPAEPVWVHADAARLEQVLVNLLTNAAKYTPPGGSLMIKLRTEGDEAVFKVRDSGIGIAPEMQTQIFDLFTQADKSLDRTQGGLGIGLAIARRLVEMHRGRIDVYSDGLGRGSEFAVWLPLLHAVPLIDRSVPTGPRSADRRMVLVVDDNRDTADSLAMTLTMTGHDVAVAYSGLDAIAAATASPPDVILLDIGLPDIDGYEVARRLRQLSELARTTLVALTGYGMERDRERSLEVGFDRHLVKPVPPHVMQDVLDGAPRRV